MGKNSTKIKRVRLPTPAQLIRSDLECETRTNLPINHCAEMLTRTLSSGPGLFAQPLLNRKTVILFLKFLPNQDCASLSHFKARVKTVYSQTVLAFVFLGSG
ncbi:hypothetical protein F6P79_00040 [Streptococcus suis]|nr:hypothetical protein [Streptococcus suis]